MLDIFRVQIFKKNLIHNHKIVFVHVCNVCNTAALIPEPSAGRRR